MGLANMLMGLGNLTRMQTRGAWNSRCERDGMVRLSVALQATSVRAAEGLLEACRFLSSSTRQDPGCVDCSVWLEPDSIVRYTELWATEPEMRRRVRSESFTSLLGIVESARHAAVQFDFVTSTRGLDYVEEVRGQPRGL
jgi:hypothetical protein